jgi:hypothetical protein
MPKKEPTSHDLVPVEVIERRILLIRGHKVMLDSHLAELYEVPTRALNQAVKRNIDRFPEDFMFRLTTEEANRSQFVTGSQKHRDPRSLPYAFTEQGVAMLSSVLKSARAVQVNIAIMRTFVRLRQILATHKELRREAHQDGTEVRQAVQGRLRNPPAAYGATAGPSETADRLCRRQRQRKEVAGTPGQGSVPRRLPMKTSPVCGLRRPKSGRSAPR